jgi:hypothetical protein
MHAVAVQAGSAVTHNGALAATAASRCPPTAAAIATCALPRSTFKTFNEHNCNIRLKQMKHLKHAFKICVYSHNNMCNTKSIFAKS